MPIKLFGGGGMGGIGHEINRSVTAAVCGDITPFGTRSFLSLFN